MKSILAPKKIFKYLRKKESFDFQLPKTPEKKPPSSNLDTQKIPIKDTIKINSIVEVEYLNIKRKLTIKFVNTSNNKMTKKDGIQKLDIKSPIGESLKGKSANDVVKIGNLDTFVKVLNVKN